MQKYCLRLNSKGINYIKKPQRNKQQKISISFYEKVIILYIIEKGKYKPNEFKKFIDSFKILDDTDQELMNTKKYLEWKHYIDAAKQQLLNKGILKGDPGKGFFLSENEMEAIIREFIGYYEIILTT